MIQHHECDYGGRIWTLLIKFSYKLSVKYISEIECHLLQFNYRNAVLSKIQNTTYNEQRTKYFYLEPAYQHHGNNRMYTYRLNGTNIIMKFHDVIGRSLVGPIIVHTRQWTPIFV